MPVDTTSQGLSYSSYSVSAPLVVGSDNNYTRKSKIYEHMINKFTTVGNPLASGVTLNLSINADDSSITKYTGGQTENVGIVFSGYFYSAVTTNYRFLFQCDDAGILFLGPASTDTITPAPTYTGVSSVPSSTTPILLPAFFDDPAINQNDDFIPLTAGTYYPILIYYIQGNGGKVCTFNILKVTNSYPYSTLISDFTNQIYGGYDSLISIDESTTPVTAPTTNDPLTTPINITPQPGFGFSYDGVDIANLVKVGTSSVSAYYKTLPLGNSSAITDTLRQIDTIGYFDTKLTDTNLAHYYTAYEIATASTTHILNTNISNYKHAKFLLIGGGGGGGGSAGVAWIYSFSNNKRNGGNGGNGGLGGMHLQTPYVPISTGNINITIGAGGAGGNRFTRGRHPFGPNDGREYSDDANNGASGGSTSIIINGITYTALGGNGGNRGNYGYGDSNGNDGTAGTNGSGYISSYPQYSGYGNGGAGGVETNGPRANGQDGNPGTSGNYGFAAIYLFRKP
jgi:hypothetical protein